MSKYWLIRLKGSGGAGIVIFLMFLGFANTVLAYPTQLELGSQNFLDGEIVKEVLKDLLPVLPVGTININTAIPILNPLSNIKMSYITAPPIGGLELKKFFSLTGVSINDFIDILKGVAVLSIQIFLTVISVVSQIVKGILQAFNINMGGL